jgi:hypothetical protein
MELIQELQESLQKLQEFIKQVNLTTTLPACICFLVTPAPDY